MTHACHANGCESPDLHREVPFCKKHWSMLPKPHQDKLWQMRPKGGCGVCEGHEEPANVLAGGPQEPASEWAKFANLGIALVCLLEYGEHDCPKELTDAQGFCWGCGVQGPGVAYGQSEKIVVKYELKVRR